MEPETLPPTMNFAVSALQEWRTLCRRHDLSPNDATRAFALSSTFDALIVVGCETKEQIETSMEVIRRLSPNAAFLAEARDLRTDEARITNQSAWH